MNDSPEGPPVLANLPTAKSDPDRTAAYETARRLVEQVMAMASAKRYEAGRTGDVPGADMAAQKQLWSANLLRSLDPDDVDEVRKVHDECQALLRPSQGSP